jgi:hypothetical protein
MPLPRSDERTRITYGPAEIAFLKQHGMLWDDTERRGRGKAFPRDLEDITDTAAGGDAAVDPTDPVPLSKIRRWPRTMCLGSGPVGEDPPRSVPKLSAAIGQPRFSTRLLTDEGRARWKTERILDVLDAERARRLGELTRPPRFADTDILASHQSGARESRLLLHRRLARQRVEENALCYVDRGVDAVAAQEYDRQRLIDTINSAAHQLSHSDFELLECLVNVTDADDQQIGLETTLVHMAAMNGLKTAAVRGIMAQALTVFRGPLSPWSTGRSGGWIPTPPPYDGAGAQAVFSMFGDADQRLPKVVGRPADYEQWTVYSAIMLADFIAKRLHVDDPPFTLAAAAGLIQEPWPPHHTRAVAAVGLQWAAIVEITIFQRWLDETDPAPLDETDAALIPRPGFPKLADVDAIVDKTPFGRTSSVTMLTREVAALAFDLPRKALDAMVKKAEKYARTHVGTRCA